MSADSRDGCISRNSSISALLRFAREMNSYSAMRLRSRNVTGVSLGLNKEKTACRPSLKALGSS